MEAMKARSAIPEPALRHVVLVGQGRFDATASPPSPDEGPRAEFIEIARALDCPIASYDDGVDRLGRAFALLFGRTKLWGSAVATALTASRYDRIYVTGEDLGLRLAMLLRARRWRGRIVCLVHNVTPARARIFRLVGPGIFARLITVCEAQSRLLTATCGIPERKITTVANWVDDRFFSPGPDVSPVAPPLFVSCGAENRDYATLEEAARHTDARFLVFGHGFFGANAARIGDTGNRPDNFVLMPRVSFPELREYYRQASAIILPLNDVPYAAGVTGLVEAMAMGKPVIVTASRGISEYLHSSPALVVPAGDAANLLASIRRFEENFADYSASGARSREWVMRNCRLDDYVARIVAIMNDRVPEGKD